VVLNIWYNAELTSAIPAKDGRYLSSTKHSDAIFNLQLNCQRTKTGMLRPAGTINSNESKLKVRKIAQLKATFFTTNF